MKEDCVQGYSNLMALNDSAFLCAQCALPVRDTRVKSRLHGMECRLFQKGAKNWAANYLGHAGKRHLFSARESQRSAHAHKRHLFKNWAANYLGHAGKRHLFSARESQRSAHARKRHLF